MNLQDPFRKWFTPRAPQSYETWNWQRKLGEIVSAYRASFDDDLFEIEPTKLEQAVRTIQNNLNRRQHVQDKTFSEFDARASNGIPKAIIGHFITFLRTYQPNNPITPEPEDTEETDDYISTSATGFTYESDLKNALTSQVEELFPGYRIYGDRGEGIEYSIGGKRIDLLLQQKGGEGLLAIELKAGIADFRVFGQISMYRGLLMEAFPNREVLGVIIAGEIDNFLAIAAKTGSGVKLMSYRMELRLCEES